MTPTRRSFLQAASAMTAAARLPWSPRDRSSNGPPLSHRSGTALSNPVLSNAEISELAARAIDAARSAGAVYADVRLTLTRRETYMGVGVKDFLGYAAGVRALVNGYWGFYSSTLWTADEMVRLARGSVAQAKANGVGKTRVVDLGTIPVAAGEWIMPVTYDPFDIPTEEKLDFLLSVEDSARSAKVNGIGANLTMDFRRQQKTFASTEGAAWSQTTYASEGTLSAGYRAEPHRELTFGRFLDDSLTVAGKGWEHFLDAGLTNRIPELMDEAEQIRHTVPVSIDRADVVCSPWAMASLLDHSIGAATELDRARGLEANAGGTSYLDDPDTMLGTFKVGSPLLNVSANRSRPGAAATVKWDDESVLPEDFVLVKDGILTDYQTTREQAAWLSPYYQKTGRPIRSHGCANAESGLMTSLQHTPNLVMHPGNDSTTYADLIADTRKGYAIIHTAINMDQQQLNGTARPIIREIVNGKLGKYFGGAGMLFRSPELWKSLTAIGGVPSVRSYGMERYKGQPSQSTAHGVTTVPGKFTNVSIIDIMRKA